MNKMDRYIKSLIENKMTLKLHNHDFIIIFFLNISFVDYIKL